MILLIYSLCYVLEEQPIQKIQLKNLHNIVDTCDKNYPMLKGLQTILKQI